MVEQSPDQSDRTVAKPCSKSRSGCTAARGSSLSRQYPSPVARLGISNETRQVLRPLAQSFGRSAGLAEGAVVAGAVLDAEMLDLGAAAEAVITLVGVGGFAPLDAFTGRDVEF